MNKSLILLVILALSVGLVSGFESDRDGNPGSPDPGDEIQCWNGQDDDTDSNVPPEASENRGPFSRDPGCTNPYWEDNNEGMIYDTHFTAAMESVDPPGDLYDDNSPDLSADADSIETFFFANREVIRNQGFPSEEVNESDTSGRYYYIDSARSEDADDREGFSAYGFGYPASTELTEEDFNTFNGQEVAITSERIIDHPHDLSSVCGNGIEDTGENSGCEGDYGEPDDDKRDERSPQGNPEAPTCNCGTNGGSNDAYESNGDYIRENTKYCSSDGPCNYQCSTDSDGDRSCGYEDTQYTNSESSDGQYLDCNNNNHVNGGGESSDGRMGNDPAATYTEYVSADDSSSAWCEPEYTVTLNADGPRGVGDGFVVIESGEIVGREAPDGSDRVGNNVHYGVEGSADSRMNTDFIQMADLGCEDRRVCIKYVDFYTDGGGWDISQSPASDTGSVENALEVRSEQYNLDQGYSVCKAANRIARKNPEGSATDIDWSSGDRLVNCDFMRDGSGFEGHASPLDEACGDQTDEHLMVMEGDVDSSTSEEWLGHEQECVDWSERDDADVDANDPSRELTRSACVNQGRPYAEGTVMNVASGNSTVYPYTAEDWEEGGDSADLQVCLDLQEDNNLYTSDEVAPKPYNYRYGDKSNNYFGGQWYDLDDERINSYLQDMEDGSESYTPGKLSSISSEAAGQANQEIDYIDYYYTENPNPYHPEYNPMGEGSPDGNRGTALLADCGPGINCGDESDNVRGSVSSENFGEGVYFAFSNHSENTFDKWSRTQEYHPQGMWSRSYNDELGLSYNIISDRPESSRQNYQQTQIPALPDFTGYLVKASSSSDQLEPGNHDFEILGLSNDTDEDWWFDTQVNADSAVQFAYAEGPDWGVDSNGVPYPPGGSSYSEEYIRSGGAETGNYRYIDSDENPRTGIEERSIDKTSKAHGNSVLVVASGDNPDYDEGQAYWIDPDDITSEWNNDNIDRAYW